MSNKRCYINFRGDFSWTKYKLNLFSTIITTISWCRVCELQGKLDMSQAPQFMTAVIPFDEHTPLDNATLASIIKRSYAYYKLENENFIVFEVLLPNPHTLKRSSKGIFTAQLTNLPYEANCHEYQIGTVPRTKSGLKSTRYTNNYFSVLKAINDDSPSVPTLLTEYILTGKKNILIFLWYVYKRKILNLYV